MTCGSGLAVLVGLAFGITFVILLAISSPAQAFMINSESDKIYLMNYNGSISVVDADTLQTKSLIVPPETEQREDSFQSSIGVNEKTNKIYVASGTRELIFVIDGEADKIVKEIPLDQYMNVMSIAVNPTTNRIYAATYGNILYVIDGSVDEIIESVDIGDHTFMSGDVGGPLPAQLSINPNTNLIYATNGGHDQIAVINGSTNRIISNITITFPFAAVINPATNKLYVTHESSESVTVFDGSSNQLLGIVPGVETRSFRNELIAIDAFRNAIYVSSYPEAGITMIDGISDIPFKTVDTYFEPVAVGVNPDTGAVYVGMDDRILEIEGIGRLADVQVGDKTYTMGFDFSNGGSITRTAAGKQIPGNMVLEITSPKDGYIDLTFPRQLYDALSFTDHPPIATVHGIDTGLSITSASCEEISVRIALREGSEEIGIVGSEILSPHTHPYPPRIAFTKVLGAGNEEFGLRVLTDALGCDVSFVKEKKLIHVDLSGTSGIAQEGFFQIAIPHDMLDGNYTVIVGGQRANFTERVFSATTNRDLSVETNEDTGIKASQLTFNYPVGTETVFITGTSAIPEFGSITLVAVFSSATFCAWFLARKVSRK